MASHFQGRSSYRTWKVHATTVFLLYSLYVVNSIYNYWVVFRSAPTETYRDYDTARPRVLAPRPSAIVVNTFVARSPGVRPPRRMHIRQSVSHRFPSRAPHLSGVSMGCHAATPPRPGQLLLSTRKRRKLTQTAVAQRLGLSQNRISHLEQHPDEISFKQLLIWCAVIGLELRLGERIEGGPGSSAEW
jgi:HTH-type transcriptional regulator/antitoxin HipB